MPMQLFWGSYAFQVNSNSISAKVQTLKNAGGQAYAQRRTFAVTAYLYGNGDTDLTQKENALKTALAVPYQDLVLNTNEGPPSSEILVNAGSITGVIITQGPDFETTNGAEYSSERKFSFTAEAEYPITGTQNYLLNFTESLTFWGGGQIYAHRLAINGPAQKQLVYPYVTFKCTQQGSAVGYRQYPGAKGPWFPLALKEAGKFTSKSPKRMGMGYQEYENTWSYEFESIAPLVAIPNIWF